MTTQRPNPALDPIRRLAKTLRDLIEDEDPGRLTTADARVLPDVVSALGFALADWLKEGYVKDEAKGYSATLHPTYLPDLIEKARALGLAGRQASST